MSVSSYQAQQMLAELRKRLGLENKPQDASGVRVAVVQETLMMLPDTSDHPE